MRTIIEIEDAFNRDISFITQEFCEFYAGESIKGVNYAYEALMRYFDNNKDKVILAQSLLDRHADFIQLKEDLVDEFGIEAFIKTKSRLEHIRDLEHRMEIQLDGKTYAAMVKELRELKGWVEKPGEPRGVSVTVHNAPARATFEQGDLKGAERVYQSLMAGK